MGRIGVRVTRQLGYINSVTPTLDLVCLGELLIDFVATETGPLRSAPGFVKAAGGAPANVAVAAARLGLRAAFIGAVGSDEFGYFLREQLERNGVDARGLVHSRLGSTPLAFVSLKKNAERDFMFYWRNTADQSVKPGDFPLGLSGECRIFHYGSISLIHPAMRSVTRAALRAAKSAGVFISCDPNLRIDLWPSPARARKAILATLGDADLVKINNDELKFLTGVSDIPRGIQALSRETDAAILVTCGPLGAAFRWRKAEGRVEGFKVAAIDGTGAGDGFVAGFLSRLLGVPSDLKKIRPDAHTISGWVRYANAVGALATTKRGAIPAFPTAPEVASLVLDRKAVPLL